MIALKLGIHESGKKRLELMIQMYVHWMDIYTAPAFPGRSAC